jgi:prephenate dehydrogenase
MTVKVTLLGLNRIGASIGLALASMKEQLVRVGFDYEPGTSRQAEKMGAIDKVMNNLHTAVADADIVIISLPVDQIRDTLEVIANDLKAGAVVVDTSPVKAGVVQWVNELLPAERYFISLTPSLNASVLLDTSNKVENARADLFQDSLMLITSPPGTDESALNLANNLTKILNATALYADVAESDGLLAATHLLPGLVSAALVNATMDQPGWREARKVASRAYTQATEPALHLEEEINLGQSALMNAENTARMIDAIIIQLIQLRDALRSADTSRVEAFLQHAQEVRRQWWVLRQKGDWEPRSEKDVKMPTGSEIFGRMFGFRPKKDKK